MLNTRILYGYRDGSNYKQEGEEVIAGSFTMEQIAPYTAEPVDEDPTFIPAQVGLRDLQPSPLNDDDHCWHEILCIEPTDEAPTLEVTAEEFVERFRTVKWNEVKHWHELLAAKGASLTHPPMSVPKPVKLLTAFQLISLYALERLMYSDWALAFDAVELGDSEWNEGQLRFLFKNGVEWDELFELSPNAEGLYDMTPVIEYLSAHDLTALLSAEEEGVVIHYSLGASATLHPDRIDLSIYDINSEGRVVALSLAVSEADVRVDNIHKSVSESALLLARKWLGAIRGEDVAFMTLAHYISHVAESKNT